MIAPVPVADPITISDQPFVILAISDVVSANVPAPPPRPIVVAAATVSKVRVPDPVNAAPRAGLPLVRIVRLLAPIF